MKNHHQEVSCEKVAGVVDMDEKIIIIIIFSTSTSVSIITIVCLF